MLTDNKIENILKGVWIAEEKGTMNIDTIRQYCPEEFDSDDLEKMVGEGLLVREADRILFSAEGKARARGVVRRHRLTESLLHCVLNLPAEKAHEIACDVEHNLPPEMEASICTLLGHPSISPEGKAIPEGDDCKDKLNSVEVAIVNLTDLEPGEQGRIAYIKPKNHARLHQLTTFGVVPGILIELHQRYPAFCIKFEETEIAVDEDVAEDIFVRRIVAHGAASPGLHR